MGKMNFKKHNDWVCFGGLKRGLAISPPPLPPNLRYDQTLTLNMASWISLKRRKVL